jgi:hypothetical protein
MTGTIVYAARSGGTVTAAVRVDEGPGRGQVEYLATVPAVDQQGNALTSTQIKALLVSAWQAQRAGGTSPPVDLGGTISGNVNL